MRDKPTRQADPMTEQERTILSHRLDAIDRLVKAICNDLRLIREYVSDVRTVIERD